MISELQLDALKEIINIGVGRSADSLNKILGKKIVLQTSVIEIINIEDVKVRMIQSQKSKLSIVKMYFNGELSGLSELVFWNEGAIEILKIMMNEAQIANSLDNQIKISALSEIGNITLNALIGTIGNLLKTRISYTLPKYFECKAEEILDNVYPMNSRIIYAETLFKVENENISGSFIIFLELSSYDKLIKKLNCYIKKD